MKGDTATELKETCSFNFLWLYVFKTTNDYGFDSDF